MYDIDGRYFVKNIDTATVLEQVYPEIVRQFEEAFEEAEVQSYEPK